MKRFLILSAKIGGVLILIVLLSVVAIIGGLRWSGEREWQQAQAELLAKGEKLTLEELLPPAPPDNENFFADPLWAEYTDMIPAMRELGVNRWQTRVPIEKRQLEQWGYLPLTPEEREREHQLFPHDKNPLPASVTADLSKQLHTAIPNELGYTNRRGEILALGKVLRVEKDPQKQKDEAALLLDLLAPAQPVLIRITELSKRSGASFPFRFDLQVAMPLPQIQPILTLQQILLSRVSPELILGKNSEAASDTLTLLRLTFIEQNEPFLISFLVRLSSVSLALEAVNKGVSRHAWTDAELRHFEEQLSLIDLQNASLFALRGERAFFNRLTPSQVYQELSSYADKLVCPKMVKAYAFLYSAFIQKDKAYQGLLVQKYLEDLLSSIPSGWNSSSQSIDREIVELRKKPVRRLIYGLGILPDPASYISVGALKAARIQTQVNQTLIACALERYRLAKGSYPPSLDAMVPEYLTTVPKEPTTGHPMQYRLLADGKFLLWAPDWNLKSLNGKPGEYSGDGDIVWNQPLPGKERPKSVSK